MNPTEPCQFEYHLNRHFTVCRTLQEGSPKYCEYRHIYVGTGTVYCKRQKRIEEAKAEFKEKLKERFGDSHPTERESLYDCIKMIDKTAQEKK